MKIHKITLTVLVAMAASCSANKLVSAQEDFAKKACACPDLACLREVQADQSSWVALNGDSAAGSASDGEKLNAAAQKMNDCATKLITAGK
jgi:hypothetical protein